MRRPGCHLESAIGLPGLFALGLLACVPGSPVTSGSESTRLSHGLLFSAWPEEGPSIGGGEMFHLLIVVPSLPEGRSTGVSSSGVPSGLKKFEFSFDPYGDGHGPAPPAIVFGLEMVESKLIRAGGREFDLLDGNLIVAVLSETGAAQVDQLPDRIPERTGASALLKAFQEELEPDHPVQQVTIIR